MILTYFVLRSPISCFWRLVPLYTGLTATVKQYSKQGYSFFSESLIEANYTARCPWAMHAVIHDIVQFVIYHWRIFVSVYLAVKNVWHVWFDTPGISQWNGSTIYRVACGDRVPNTRRGGEGCREREGQETPSWMDSHAAIFFTAPNLCQTTHVKWSKLDSQYEQSGWNLWVDCLFLAAALYGVLGVVEKGDRHVWHGAEHGQHWLCMGSP